MGKATVYCEICGEVIPGDDFTKGRAVHHQEKDYCAKCKQEISHLLPPADDPDGLARKTSRIRTVDPSASTASGVRKSSGIRAPSGIRRTAAQTPAVASTPARGAPNVRGNGQREHPSQLHAPKAASSTSQEKKLYLVGGGAVLLVIVVIAIVSWRSSEAEKALAAAQINREQAAKDAYMDCSHFAESSPGSFGPLLQKCADAKAAVQGTDWEVQLASLQHKTEVLKKKKEDREELVTKVDNERLRIGSEPKAAREIKSNLETYAKEAGEDDKELQEKISKGIEEARRTAVRTDFEEVNQFVLQNPNDYEPALDKYHTVKEELAEFPQDFQEEMIQQIDQRVEWVKQGRETAANGMWQSVKGSAEQAREQHNFAEAKRQANNFLLNDQFKNCKAMDEARSYIREVEQEEQAYQKQQQPPPDPNPPGPGPGPAAGGKATLFDGSNPPNVIKGTGSWEVSNGELVAVSSKGGDPPKGNVNINDLIQFNGHSVERCTVEMEVKIVKGGFWVGIGLRPEPGSGKVIYTAGVVQNVGEGSALQPNTWYRMKLDYDGKNCMVIVEGVGTAQVEIKNPGSGCVAIGLYDGCETHFRRVELTPK